MKVLRRGLNVAKLAEDFLSVVLVILFLKTFHHMMKALYMGVKSNFKVKSSKIQLYNGHMTARHVSLCEVLYGSTDCKDHVTLRDPLHHLLCRHI